MALQRTAQDACSRKVHCVAKKYLDDPYVGFFTKDSTIINSPLMNRGTWLRTKAIEYRVTSFARTAGCPIQVISFGAGVDTLYFRLRKDHPDVQLSKYVELDFADLIEDKRRIIERHEIMRKELTDAFVLLPCDLRRTKEVTDLLKQHVRSGVPTIIIAEMVFVYIEGSITTELLRSTLHDVLGAETNVELVTYDAMKPNDRFGEMMVENLSSVGVELKGIHDFPTAEAHAERSKQVGFKGAQALSMRQLYLNVPMQLQRWLNSLEMIDDWDEWNLVHDHYCFLVATTRDTPLTITFS